MHEKFVAGLTPAQQQRTAPMDTSAPVPPVQRLTTVVVPNRGTSYYRNPLLLSGNYFWLHGYRLRNSHASATCTHPKERHQIAATRANTIGGSTSGQAAVNAAIAEANPTET